MTRQPRRATRAVRDAIARLGRPVPDPTRSAPPAYTLERAGAVYEETVLRCFEYLSATRVYGHVLEFGTYRGYTARLLASHMRRFAHPGELFLYDSFEGLPEIQAPQDQTSYEVQAHEVWFKGQMALPRHIDQQIAAALRPLLPEGALHVIKGFFEDTVPAQLPAGSAALVHLDCDLYASARHVLDQLLAADLLQDGALLVCDDWNCNRANPDMGERAAVRDAFTAQQRFSTSHWFSYGWHGQVLFVHDAQAGPGQRR